MSDVVRKGFLEVKKRNLFGSAYKEKYIILRNSADHKCKVVEIQDSEDGDDTRETVKLNDAWIVQDKPSKRGKYTFELVMGEEAILTFGCPSVIEREEWTEAFRILNQLAPAFVGTQLAATPIKDYFSVNLIQNRSAMEINHSGQYLLSITTSAIILHWRTLAIAHQWSRRSVIKLYHPHREGHLVLNTHRVAGGPPMEFEFVTDANSSMEILKLWNIRLLESIPRTQQRFSEPAAFASSKHQSSKERRSFRTPKAPPIVNDNDLRRAGSFSKMHTLGTGLSLVGATLNGRRSWGGSNEIYPPPIPSSSQLSQDSVFNSLTSAPPLPPRPEESDSDEEDPDYAYIDENKVKGPESQRGRARTVSSTGMGGRGRMGSPTLDDQLEALKKDIMRENKKKKREKAATLHFPSRSSPRARLPMNFVRAEPEDYLEPVSSKRITSTSSEGLPKRERDRLSPNTDISRSLSDHGPHTNHSSSSSIGNTACEVFDDSQTPPDAHGGGGDIPGGPGGNPPALPPRPWRNSSVTSTSSVSSATSPNSGTVPPLTNPNTPGGNHPSLSEENPTPENVDERKVSTPPNLSPPKDTDSAGNGSEQASKPAAAASAADVVGNGRHLSPKDGSLSPIEVGSSSTTSASPPPPLPPRSPTRDRLSRKSSSSSVSSNASCSRCPRCRSLKKTKTLVSKTTSLDQRAAIQAAQPLSREDSRKSLPDLNNASPFPENNLAQNRQRNSRSTSHEHNHVSSCSKCSVGSSTDGLPNEGAAAASNSSIPSSSSQNFEYLQLLSEESEKKTAEQQQANIDTDVSSALDLLSSCLQGLEYLENKVNQNALQTGSSSPNQLKNKTAAAFRSDERKVAQTDIDAAMKQTEQVCAELNMAGSGRHVHSVSSSSFGEEKRKVVANGHPPLLKKRNTVASFGTSSSPSSSPMVPLSSTNSLPLHWTQQPPPGQHPNHPVAHTNGTIVRNSSSSSLVTSPASVGSPRPFQLPSSVFSPRSSVVATPTPEGGAPPVPPRSLVSLGEVQPSIRPQSHGHHVMNRSVSQINTRPHPQQQRSLSKTNSLGRHMSSWKAVYGEHHAPQRSGSSVGMVPGNHVDSNHQSDTVFIHHLNRHNTRPRQIRAHLV